MNMGSGESKIALSECLNRFIHGTVSTEESDYWNSLTRAPLSFESIQEALKLEDIRRLRQQQSPNLECFFIKVLEELHSIIDIGTYSQMNREACQTALTCVRLLTRVIPVLLEIPPSQPLLSDIELSSGEATSDITTTATPSLNSNTIRNQSDQYPEKQKNDQKQNQHITESEFVYRLFWQCNIAAAPSDMASQTGDSNTTEKGDTILAIQVLTALQRLLFLRGFTVSASGSGMSREEIPPKHKVDTRFLWKGGIGVTQEAPASTTAMIKARTEILRCLLGCISSTLYTTVEGYQSGSPPLWLWVFTRGYVPFTANLYCALMSTIFSHDPESYGFGLISSSPEEEELIAVSLQLLCILVDFNFSINGPHQERDQINDYPNSKNLNQMTVDPRQPGDSNAIKRSSSSSVNVVRNAYRLMLAGMKKDSEINLAYSGTLRLLGTISKSKSGYIRSMKMFASYQELLILFWHLLTINTHFIRRISSRPNSNQILQPLLILLLENSTTRRLKATSKSSQSGTTTISTPKTTDTEISSPISNQTRGSLMIPSVDQERIGLLHLCSFILLVLSSEREFAVGLNAEYREKFPLYLPAFRGSYADLLVIVTHRVILDSLGAVANDSLIDMLLTVLCNIPSWLFKASYHYHNVFFLLDVLNNAVQYQYEGNLCLVYSILRQKDLFIDLQNLTFPKNLLSSSSTLNNEDGSLTIETTPSDQSPSTLSEEHLGIESSWKPTEKWFTDWKSRLPLHTTLRLITCLLPMVEAECQERGLINQNEVLEYLKRTTMVGLLPVPHAIIIRNYHPNTYTGLWFTTYTWSVVVSRTHHLHLFDLPVIRFLSIINGSSS